MDDLLTVNQVARLLKVHSLTVRRYINEGRLKAIRLGGNIRVSQSELKSFSETYISNSNKQDKTTSNSSSVPFSTADPLFRLKGRGLSLDNVDR